MKSKNIEGRDSPVGIGNGYGMDHPGIEFGRKGGGYFSHQYRPDLRLIEPAVKWVPGLFSGGKAAECGVDHPFLM